MRGLSAENEIREVGRGLSLADTQTGRCGGFTLDDGYVRGVVADAQRFTGSLLDRLDVPDTFFQNTIVLTTKSLVPIPVAVSRANAYSGGVLTKALPNGLHHLST
jgi:hypothetical protein